MNLKANAKFMYVHCTMYNFCTYILSRFVQICQFQHQISPLKNKLNCISPPHKPSQIREIRCTNFSHIDIVCQKTQSVMLRKFGIALKCTCIAARHVDGGIKVVYTYTLDEKNIFLPPSGLWNHHYLRLIKGTVVRDFWALVFFMNQ